MQRQWTPWRAVRVFFPKVCVRSGKRIPMFSKAFKQESAVWDDGVCQHQVEYITQTEYTFRTLKRKM